MISRNEVRGCEVKEGTRREVVRKVYKYKNIILKRRFKKTSYREIVEEGFYCPVIVPAIS